MDGWIDGWTVYILHDILRTFSCNLFFFPPFQISLYLITTRSGWKRLSRSFFLSFDLNLNKTFSCKCVSTFRRYHTVEWWGSINTLWVTLFQVMSQEILECWKKGVSFIIQNSKEEEFFNKIHEIRKKVFKKYSSHWNRPSFFTAYMTLLEERLAHFS